MKPSSVTFHRKITCNTPAFGRHVAAMCSQHVRHMSLATGGHVRTSWPLGSTENGGIVLSLPAGGQRSSVHVNQVLTQLSQYKLNIFISGALVRANQQMRMNSK